MHEHAHDTSRHPRRPPPEVRLWRRVPVRGAGKLVVSLLGRRATRGAVHALGPGGCELHVDRINPPELSVYLWGTYEPEVVWALEALSGSGGMAVDVGANCGVLTMTMSHLGYAPVIAIDPSEKACSRIAKQAQGSHRDVRAFRLGLGASSGSLRFYSGTTGLGVLPGVDTEYTTAESTTVEVARLDKVLSDRGIQNRVRVIKIDSDGSEAEILTGASETVDRWRPALIFELFIAGMRRRGSAPERLVEFLRLHDYELFAPEFRKHARWRVDPPRCRCFIPIALEDLLTGRYDEMNLVALPVGSEDRDALVTPRAGSAVAADRRLSRRPDPSRR